MHRACIPQTNGRAGSRMLARSWAEKTRSLDRSFVVGPPVESIRNRFRGNDHRRRRQRGTTATESDRIDHRAGAAGGVGIAATDRPNPREMSRTLAGRRASGTPRHDVVSSARTDGAIIVLSVPRCRVYLYLYLYLYLSLLPDVPPVVASGKPRCLSFDGETQRNATLGLRRSSDRDAEKGSRPRSSLPPDIISTAISPASAHLFKVNSDGKKLSTDKKQKFHHHTAQLLFLAKRAEPDIQTAVAFLCTRVHEPDEDDYEKLARVMIYIEHSISTTNTLIRKN